MMTLNLDDLHTDILKHNKTYDVFDYTHNKIEFSVMFDVGSNPFKLVFVKKKTSLYLILDVSDDYQINTYLGDKLQVLKDMLELKRGKTPFSTNKFFEEFNKKIPKHVQNRAISRTVLCNAYKCEEKEKTNIQKLMDWDDYPHLNKHASPENHEKTRLLYPEIYEQIKGKNISVFYTD